jgi:hypothetical protein
MSEAKAGILQYLTAIKCFKFKMHYAEKCGRV